MQNPPVASPMRIDTEQEVDVYSAAKRPNSGRINFFIFFFSGTATAHTAASTEKVIRQRTHTSSTVYKVACRLHDVRRMLLTKNRNLLGDFSKHGGQQWIPPVPSIEIKRWM